MKRLAVSILLLVMFCLSACGPPRDEVRTIPGGKFIAGDTSLGSYDNREHEATVGTFRIHRTEITNDNYEKCVWANACQPRHNVPRQFAAPELPAVAVTWLQAERYCQWRGMRLPTEAEWEHAARGKNNTRYPWGNIFENEAANSGYSRACERDGKIYRFTAPSGCFPRDRSSFDVLDMAGNVAEWTADAYNAEPTQPFRGNDPNPPRVVKGGYFFAEAVQCSGAWREPTPADNSSEHIGFRCVK